VVTQIQGGGEETTWFMPIGAVNTNMRKQFLFRTQIFVIGGKWNYEKNIALFRVTTDWKWEVRKTALFQWPGYSGCHFTR
jgi:hypothetical protein